MSCGQPLHAFFEWKNIFGMSKAQAYEVENFKYVDQGWKSIIEEKLSSEDWL